MSGSFSITIKNTYITIVIPQLCFKSVKFGLLKTNPTYHSLYSHYWSPHYLPIPCIFFYRKWLGRTLQPEPPRGRNSRHHAALRPLMPLRAPPLNRWMPHYRVSTLGLCHRQVTILYLSILEITPEPPLK